MATTAAVVAIVLLAATLVSAIFGVAAVRAREAMHESLEEARRSRDEAVTAKASVEQRNLELERIAYASEIRSIQELWNTGMLTDLDHRLDATAPEHRGIEWDMLRPRVEPVAAREIQLEDLSIVRVLEPSPDGSRFLVGSRSGAARIYLASTWQVQVELPRQSNRIADGDFNPAGDRVMLCLERGGLAFFDAQSGRELARSPAPSFAAAFSPDGARIASADGGGRISLLDSNDLTVRAKVANPGAVVKRLEFSPDGKRLLAACSDGWARLIDAGSGSVVEELLHNDDGQIVWAARFSPDGRRIVTAGVGGRVLGWSDVGAYLQEYEPHQQRMHSGWRALDVDFSADGRTMASCGGDGLVRIHNLETGAVDCRLKDSFPADAPRRLRQVRFDAAGARVVAAGANGTIHVWQLDGAGIPLEMIGHTRGIQETCSSPDGAFAFTAGLDGTLRKWDLLTGVEVFARQVASFAAQSVDVTRDGALVVVGTDDGQGSILDAASGEVLRTFAMPRGTGAPVPDGVQVGLTTIRFSPDQRTIAAGVGTFDLGRNEARKTPIHLFDLQTGELLATRDGHHGGVGGLAFTSDSATLFSVGNDGRLLRWDLRSTDPPVVVATRPGFALDVLVNEREGEVLWALSTGQVEAFDIETGALKWSFQAHDSAVSSLDMSPDGSRLLTSGRFFGGVSLWDTTSRKKLLTLAAGIQTVNSARLAGNGRVIVADGGWGLGYFTDALYCFEAVPAEGRITQRLAVRREQAERRDRWLELQRAVDRAVDARQRRDFAEAEQLLSQIVTRAGERPWHDPVLEARIRRRVAAQLYDLARYDEAIEQNQRAVAIYEDQGSATTHLLVRALRQICWCDIRKSRFVEAQERGERALSLCRAEFGEHHEETMWAMTTLANAYLNDGDAAPAAPLYERALELSRDMFGEEHANTANALQNISRLYQQQGRLEDALSAATEALRIQRRLRGEESSSTFFAMSSVGNVYAQLGRYDEAIEMLSRALELRRDVLGPLHRDTLLSMRTLAGVYARAGRYAEAAAVQAELYAARSQVLGPEHPETLLALATMAGDELLSGDHERGEMLARQALEALLSSEPDATIAQRLNDAAWYVVVHPDLTPGLYALAHEAAQRSVQLDEQLWRLSLNTLGTAQYRVREYEEALAALARSDEINAADGGSYAGDWAFMAMAHHQLGETDKARAALARCRKLMQLPAHASNAECLAFLREAEALIESE
jgi:WD40 repeat protein/Tfp pilus assembly protein PilF